MIQTWVRRLVDYGEKTGLIACEDRIYTTNRLLEILRLDSAKEPVPEAEEAAPDLEEILAALLDYSVEKGLVEDTPTCRDLFDTGLMGALVARPSQVISRFYTLYREESPQAATDDYYRFSIHSDYIRSYRIARDKKWVTETPYGDLDITINLSKPEKDPRAIAAAGRAVSAGYPKCLLCRENEGYAGRLDHPARQNHRIIPVEICGSRWGLQYSPYVYYREHCIVFHAEHTPMRIERATFARLLDFVRQFPHYFVGSNADLPIVGGSILRHDHFQGGRYEFAMARAPIEKEFVIPGFEEVSVGIVRWPMSVLRLAHRDIPTLIGLADHILQVWRGYTDEEAFIYAHTEGEPHNTITPIARKRGDLYELDLVLRNNITTAEHPLGVFHPHAPLHHIKKENIGLIEVMGLAVLPARLKHELELLKEALLQKRDISEDPVLGVHGEWADMLVKKYGDGLTEKAMENILQKEVGLVFQEVLEDSGVYKCTPEGRAAFERFVEAL